MKTSFYKKKAEIVYMHKHTGSIDTEQGWIDSYDEVELEERGLTAEQAFYEDEGELLYEVSPEEIEDMVGYNDF